MIEPYEMLEELREMVLDGEIANDKCEHDEYDFDPKDDDMFGKDFCTVCFINNLYMNVSLEDPNFTEETTERQRQVINNLWERHCNFEGEI